MKNPKSARSDATPTLLSLPLTVDLIRFEKNLLQIGFFGAHDTRHRTDSSRRIESWVNRDGQKIKVAAEFRASQALGLPSTSDRDKYLAFMKIAMEQKSKNGQLENPIRFTGYQMLKDLGLTFSGENYDDINRWGQRLADTTITSEQVIYLAVRKKYVNKTVHVFRSFSRAGESNANGTTRTESFEVVLEDWLLDNLNQSYVVPEDFTAYRKLRRATAKGIFGYLHLWFHASQGRPIEKDYAELCLLLNVPVYRHLSKIKETMGRSLDELLTVGYLAGWDIKPMITKDGYKLVLQPGEELLHVLAISQRRQLTEAATPKENALTEMQQHQLDSLLARGVTAAKATSLVQQFPPEILDTQVAYAESVMARNRGRKFTNPAGFLIYVIENQLGISDGVAARHSQESSSRPEDGTALTATARLEQQLAYETYVSEQVQRAVDIQFPETMLAHKIKEVIRQKKRADERFDRFSPAQQETLVEQLIRKEVREKLQLPDFDEWREQHPQAELFSHF